MMSYTVWSGSVLTGQCEGAMQGIFSEAGRCYRLLLQLLKIYNKIVATSIQ
jgi:hypothetical protein